jgi:hypothetical protein
VFACFGVSLISLRNNAPAALITTRKSKLNICFVLVQSRARLQENSELLRVKPYGMFSRPESSGKLRSSKQNGYLVIMCQDVHRKREAFTSLGTHIKYSSLLAVNAATTHDKKEENMHKNLNS